MNTLFRDRLIPWYFVAFFAVVAVVDGVMVTLAVRTQTGLVTEHAYEKGLAYNKIVDAEERQEALGWRGKIQYTNGFLYFTLEDGAGKPLHPRHIKASISRPTQAGLDFSSILIEGAAAVHFPLKGIWDVRVDAEYRGKHYQQTERLVIE